MRAKPQQLLRTDIACNGSVVNPDSGALEVGDNATSDTHDVRWRGTEVVVPRSRCCPHLVVLQQIGVYEHAQLCAVAKWGHAVVGLGKPSSNAPPTWHY